MRDEVVSPYPDSHLRPALPLSCLPAVPLLTSDWRKVWSDQHSQTNSSHLWLQAAEPCSHRQAWCLGSTWTSTPSRSWWSPRSISATPTPSSVRVAEMRSGTQLQLLDKSQLFLFFRLDSFGGFLQVNVVEFVEQWLMNREIWSQQQWKDRSKISKC